MTNASFNLKKALQLFGASPESIQTNEALPPFSRGADQRTLKSWTLQDLPLVGAQLGFMAKPRRPIAISVFVTKGGVLKSSLALNFARLAALNGIRTCVVGLDMQGDITSAMNPDSLNDEDVSLRDALKRVSAYRGLPDVYDGSARLEDVVRKTDIPNLFYIPETPELVSLDQNLINRNRREYWLRDHVIKSLKERFDLILIDCSPNWNRLITNALVASDVLLSPLECKINNFRNFKMFFGLLKEFREDMGCEFRQIYVPTRVATNRKLNREIFDWYRSHLPECTSGYVRESVQGEEATALRVSIPEHQPTSVAATEMRELVSEIWARVGAPIRRTATAAADRINERPSESRADLSF